jgi:hypothetical protein
MIAHGQSRLATANDHCIVLLPHAGLQESDWNDGAAVVGNLLTTI